MTDINHLQSGVDPPKDEKTVIVLRDVTGGFYVDSTEPGYQRGAPISEYPIDEGERERAIERAKAYADRNAVKTVYVIS
jgi:isocitrate/isopropylmalate dehydrogenase